MNRVDFEQNHVRNIAAFFTRLIADAADAVCMFFDWLLGKFEWSPIRLIIALIAGLAYLISPVDIIPDAIPLAGWIDDLLVATAVIRLAYADIKRWREWKSGR